MIVSAKEWVLLNKTFPFVPQETLGASAFLFLCLGSQFSCMLCSQQIWSTVVAKCVCSVRIFLWPSSLFMN